MLKNLNLKIPDMIKPSGKTLYFLKIPDMIEYLNELGYIEENNDKSISLI